MTLEDIFSEEETSTDIFDGFKNPLKEEKKQDNNDSMLEKTLEIETLDLNFYLDKDQKVEKPEEETIAKEVKVVPEEIKKKKKKDHTIQESFINCSVLGFITAFMGAGWLINIINHI